MIESAKNEKKQDTNRGFLKIYLFVSTGFEG
jgi:hypothetical protein